MKVIQLLPTLAFGDAVGNDVRALKKLLTSLNVQTEIFAENIDPRLQKGEALPVSKMPKLDRRDTLIYHLSVGTDLNNRMDSFACRKIMVYHNITPPSFFEPYSKTAEELSITGLKGMVRLRNSFDYCLADSEFNRDNLLDAGYSCPIDIRPILIPFSDYERTPDRPTLERFRDGRTNIIFVGRISPNKRQENVIRAFFHYKNQYDRNARLILVGASGGMEPYLKRLKDYVRLLGLEKDVTFLGHVSFETILAVYRTASAFLCMSEHEGFCVPLVEAMLFDVPVIAYRSCAVPDTMGGSGILLDSNAPELAAAALHRAMTDVRVRDAVIQGQRRRLADFSYEKISGLFTAQLRQFLDREGRK